MSNTYRATFILVSLLLSVPAAGESLRTPCYNDVPTYHILNRLFIEKAQLGHILGRWADATMAKDRTLAKRANAQLHQQVFLYPKPILLNGQQRHYDALHAYYEARKKMALATVAKGDRVEIVGRVLEKLSAFGRAHRTLIDTLYQNDPYPLRESAPCILFRPVPAGRPPPVSYKD